jgi:hypothetical protein
MRKTIASLVLAFSFLMAGYNLPAKAAEALCPSGTKTQFLSEVMVIPKIQVFGLTASGNAKVLARINKNWKDRGINKVAEFTELMFAVLDGDKVGIVWFDKDGCTVPGSAIVLTIPQFVQFLADAGIDDKVDVLKTVGS